MMSEAEQANAEAQREFGHELTRVQNDATDASENAYQRLKYLIQDTSRSMDKLTIDLNAQRDQAINKGATIEEEGQSAMGEIDEMSQEVIDLAEDTIGLIGDTTDETEGMIADKSDETVDDIVSQIEEQVESMEEGYEIKKEDVSEKMEEYQGKVEDLEAEIDGTLEQDGSAMENLNAVDKEFAAAKKVMTKDRANFASSSNRVISRVLKTAKKLPVTLRAMADRANTAAKRGIGNVVKMTQKEVNMAMKEANKEKDEIVNGMQAAYDEVKNEHLQSMFDFRQQKMAMKKEQAETELELNQLLLEAEAENVQAATERDDLSNLGEDHNADAKETLEEDKTIEKGEEEQLNADLTAAESQAKDKRDQERADMVSAVNSHLTETRAAIEEESAQAQEEFKMAMQNSMTNMDKGVALSRSRSSDLEARMDLGKTRLDTVNSAVAVQMERNEELLHNLLLMQNKSVEDVKKGLADNGGEAEDKMEKSEEGLFKQVKETSQNQESLAKSVGERLAKKVTDLGKTAKDQLDRSGRTLHTTAQHAQDTLRNMNVLAESIERLSERLHNLYPGNAEMAGETLTGMEAAMLAAENENLPTVRDAAQATLQTWENNFHDDAKHELGKVRENVDEVLHASAAQLAQMMEQILGAEHEFKDISTGNFNEFYRYNFDSLNSVAELIARFKAAQQEGAEVEEATTSRVKQLRNLVDTGIKAQTRDSKVLERAWILQFLKARAIARDKAAEMLQETSDADDAAISGAEGDGTRKIEAAKAMGENRTGEAELEVKAVQDVVQKELARMNDFSVQVKAKQLDLQRHMTSTETILKRMQATAADRIEAMRSLLQSQKSSMESEMQTQLGNLRNEENEMAARTTKSALAEIQAEEKKEALLGAQQASEFNSLTTDLRSRLQPVRDAAEATQASANALVDSENEAQTGLVKGLVGLEAAEKMGEDAVEHQAQSEMRDSLGTAKDDSNLMEQVVSGAIGANGAVNNELAEGNEILMSAMDKSRQAAEQAATQLSEQAYMLNENAPDVAGMYVNDTQEARDEIEAGWSSLDTAMNWTYGAFNQYNRGLDESRKERSKLATQLHNRISKSKAEIVNKTWDYTEDIEGAKKIVDATEAAFEANMRTLKAKMNTLGQVSSNHDGDDLETLDKTLNAFRHVHHRLAATYGHFYHHGEAFRAEVDRQLNGIANAQEEEEQRFEAKKLGQQVHMNQALRSTMLRMQKGVDAQTNEQAHNLGQLSMEIGDGLHALLDSEAADRRQSDAAQAQAYAMLDERSQETKDAMGIAMENDAALRAAVEQLRQEQGTTAAEIKGALFLPQLTSGPKNEKLNNKMEEIRARMDRAEIAAVGSLLEAGPPSSLAETGAQLAEQQLAEQRAESRMERAVEGMNAELAAQNHRLQRQNMRLQDGLTQAWQQVASSVGALAV